MQKLLALTAALLSSSAIAVQLGTEMMPGTCLPPDYVILHFEADQLEAAGDYEAAELKRAEAIAAYEAGLAAYEAELEAATTETTTTTTTSDDSTKKGRRRRSKY